jgi:hypothetical protein
MLELHTGHQKNVTSLVHLLQLKAEALRRVRAQKGSRVEQEKAEKAIEVELIRLQHRVNSRHRGIVK